MKASELRIGSNYSANGQMFLMDERMMYAFMCQKYPYVLENIEPIPITHELLRECGLETKNGILYEETITGFKYDYADRRHWAGKLGGIGYQKGTCVFLHQLQNLYFALTGEELTVKLPVTA